MIKVESRAELGKMQGRAPAAPAARPVQAPDNGIKELAQAVQESAAQTQRGMTMLVEAMLQARPEPRPRSLVADVERDENGKMTRVIISVER